MEPNASMPSDWERKISHLRKNLTDIKEPNSAGAAYLKAFMAIGALEQMASCCPAEILPTLISLLTEYHELIAE